MLRPLQLALVLVLVLAGGCSAPARRRADVLSPPASRADARAPPASAVPVASTARFVFYSRFDFNLHDRLRRWALEDDPGARRCIEALDPATRQRWDRAVDAFRALGAEGGDRIELSTRFAMIDPALGAPPSWHPVAIDEARAAYARCFWGDDDRANRAWIAALVARLERAEEPMASRIAAAHVARWRPGLIPVDVVPYVNFGGASTVRDPDHVLISSVQPGYDGHGAVEMIFHEASHTIVAPRDGGSALALVRASEALGVALHRDLWHVVLFYVAGDAAREVARELSGEPYTMYMDSEGVLDRAWPRLREPLERYWAPYLRGDATLDEAARGLVTAAAVDEPSPLRDRSRRR
jgi:hypothetical protein